MRKCKNKMEVAQPTNFDQLERLNGNYPSKDLVYFRFNDSRKGGRSPNEPLAGSEENRPPVCKYKPSSFLLVWGCGEFGQHGYDTINGDVPLNRSLAEHNLGRLLLGDEAPAIVACGSSHTLVLSENGKLYSWGNGTSGQLGTGSSQTVCKPMLVSLGVDTAIQGMACGARHSFIWTANGHCYSFGNNFSAQLGYNFSKADFKENQLQPVHVQLLPHMMVKEVACGARHTLFLLTTGHVLAVGCNQQGQIGNGSTDDVVIPTKLDDLSNISHIACGNSHSLASDEENDQLYSWGYGKALGTKTRHVVSPKSFSLHRKDYGFVVSLAGGDSHSMVLYQNGVLYTWGNNYEGQLGLGKSTKYQSEPEPIPNSVLPRPIVQISCGETTCAAVNGEGKLYMWGKNAGVIHSDKPSQYFQFEPHHIDTEDKLVTQVSCGAWHVSAIVKNCAKLINTCTNIQEFETSKNDFVEEEVYIQCNANHFQNESCDVLEIRQSNITKEAFTDNAKLSWVSSCEDLEREQGLAAKNDLSKTICNDLNLGEKRPGTDLTCNTEGTTSYRVRHVDNKTTLSQLSNIYCEKNGHSVDHNNDFRETDSLNSDQNNFEDMARGLSENKPIQKNNHETVKHNVLDSGTGNDIQDYGGMNHSIVTDIFQPESKKSEEFKSKLETVEKSSEEPATNEAGHETFNHSETFYQDVHLHADNNKRITRGIIEENTQKGKSEGFETKLEAMEKANNDPGNHSFRNLGAKNNAHNYSKTMYQSESVLTENTLSNKRFNETEDFPKAHRRVTDISVWHSIGVKQHKPIFRQSSTPPSSKVVDTNVLVQKQAMPVINLSFKSSLERLTAPKDCQPKKQNPSFFTIQNMWINSSKLLREKQGKKLLTRHTRSDSEMEFVLESMLPNRPTHTVSEVKKWAKFKDSSVANAESTKKVAKHTTCNHPGKLLPPIYSCRNRSEASLGQQQTFKNVFIDRE